MLAAVRPALDDLIDLPAPEIVASALGPGVVAVGAIAAALETARTRALHLQAPSTG